MHFLNSVIAALRVTFLAAFAGAAVICGGATAAIAQSSDGDSGYSDKDVDLDVLIEAIDDYGKWRQHEAYGDVWIPEVADDWRPYTLGQWAYDETAGWTWVSEEPFGWVVYHYGRWTRDDDLGWFWVPGTKWAPAWVAWREADEHIGWAPLPPEPADYTGPPYERTVIYDEPRYETFWVFATYALFARPHIHRHVIWHRHDHYHGIYRKSRRGHHARWRHRRIVNRGVSLKDLRKRARRHVRPAHAVVSHRERARSRRHRQDGRGIVQVYRPSADAKPRRARRHEHAKRRFHNADDRRANLRRNRAKERGTASRHNPEKRDRTGRAAQRGHVSQGGQAAKGGQAAAQRALRRKAATAERRANRGGRAEGRKARQHRNATPTRQARPKAQRGAERKARPQRKASPNRRAQRRATHSRKARPNRSAGRSRASSRPRARPSRARSAPRARSRANSRPRAGRSQARRQGGGGQRGRR